MPSVSRNQPTVSLNFGVISTPWPMRLTCAGPRGSRISSPARAVGASPELSLCRFTGIGATCCDAADHFDLIAVRLGEPHALAAAGLVDGLDAGGAGRLGEPLQVVFALDVIGEARRISDRPSR